jgi:spermidine/putrescine transport system permease protein
LIVFFLVPLIAQLSLSLETGNVFKGLSFSWHFGEYLSAIKTYHTQFVRSLVYGGASTVISLVLMYPVAYWIAFRGGRHKSTFLLLILLPFFVSFLIRTLAWQFILADNGIVLGTLKNLHLLPKSLHVLSTPWAVIAGLTYNELPFMALPLYVALEKIEPSVIEAGADLYANPAQRFLKLILPLSSAGVYAGFLLVFVTNVGDFVSAAILGGTDTTMIGNIIQTQFLENQNYPLASALSTILMAGLLIFMYIYARSFGTESVEDFV